MGWALDIFYGSGEGEGKLSEHYTSLNTSEAALLCIKTIMIWTHSCCHCYYPLHTIPATKLFSSLYTGSQKLLEPGVMLKMVYSLVFAMYTCVGEQHNGALIVEQKVCTICVSCTEGWQMGWSISWFHIVYSTVAWECQNWNNMGLLALKKVSGWLLSIHMIPQKSTSCASWCKVVSKTESYMKQHLIVDKQNWPQCPPL